MPEINNNSYSINISELLKKLVNIEETSLDGKKLKSIFENYNTKKGENEFEILEKEELENFVKELKEYVQQVKWEVDFDKLTPMMQHYLNTKKKKVTKLN